MAALQINDREPAKAEAEWSGKVIALVIRPAMGDAPGHPLQILADHRSLVAKVILSADAAHDFVNSVLQI